MNKESATAWKGRFVGYVVWVRTHPPTEKIAKVSEGRVTIQLNRNLDVQLACVPWNVVDLVSPLFIDWQRQREVHERIKSN